MQFTLEHGDIFPLPETATYEEYKDPHCVVCLPPQESLLKYGKILVCLMRRGIASLPFEVAYGKYRIQPAHHFMATEDKLKKIGKTDTLSEEKRNELLNALAFTEMTDRMKL